MAGRKQIICKNPATPPTNHSGTQPLIRKAGLLVDTHGAAVIDPVWALLEAAYARIGGEAPTCLERDFNLPDLTQLTAEVGIIARLQAAAQRREAA